MDGVFAIYKPSGPSSAKFLDALQDKLTKSSVFSKDLQKAKEKMKFDLGTNKKMSQQRIDNKVRKLKIKMGHGGTLDPLASGVMVVGIGAGTKKLQYYLTGCVKQYRTKALLGISTTTGDSEGDIITKNKINHITKEMILETAEKFRGDLKQTPPIFSALKLNGLPLYDYARKGIPLPTVIKCRDINISSLVVHEEDSLSTDHEFVKVESQLDEDGNPKEHGLKNNPTLNDSPLYFSSQYLEKANIPQAVVKPLLLDDGEELPEKLPMFHMTTDVSSGTYIRSLISDFGRAMESSAYMVELERSSQSQWKSGKNVFKMDDFERDEKVWGPVLKKVFDTQGEIDIDEEFLKATEAVAAEKTNEIEAPADQSEEATTTKAEELDDSSLVKNIDSEEAPLDKNVDSEETSVYKTEDDKVTPKKRGIQEVET